MIRAARCQFPGIFQAYWIDFKAQESSVHAVGTCTVPTQPAGINAPDGRAFVRAQFLAAAFAGS